MTPAISTDGAEGVAVRRWYVLHVALRSEKAVRDRLLDLGVEAYVATRQEIHLWRRSERRIVEQVLIPAVVFVYVADSERIPLLRLPGIHSYMTNPASQKTALGRNRLAIVPDAEMHTLQSILRQSEFDVAFATTNFAVGNKVRILGLGSDEHIAQIVNIPNDPASYVGIRLPFLGCAYMQLPLSRILKIPQ